MKIITLICLYFYKVLPISRVTRHSKISYVKDSVKRRCRDDSFALDKDENKTRVCDDADFKYKMIA